jgi:cation-transporting ATPase I
MGLTALVGTQLAQTLLTRHRSPLVIATAAGSAVVLVGIVQTPGISHFFGCTPLGPVAWTGVLAATTTTAVASVFVPQWLAKYATHLSDPDADTLPDITLGEIIEYSAASAAPTINALAPIRTNSL